MNATDAAVALIAVGLLANLAGVGLNVWSLTRGGGIDMRGAVLMLGGFAVADVGVLGLLIGLPDLGVLRVVLAIPVVAFFALKVWIAMRMRAVPAREG